MAGGKESTPHIGIFGKRNVGKSSFINCITHQEIAIVSDVAGTTTDPVKKSYEILGFGPVIFIDTAGIDDSGTVGNKRVKKSLDVLQIINLAILLVANNNLSDYEINLINKFNELNIPYVIINNKTDIEKPTKEFIAQVFKISEHQLLEFSSLNNSNVESILNEIKKAIPNSSLKISKLLKGYINKNDFVVLITPIDSEAPEGRMILPQVQVLRDVLDNNAICIILKETEAEYFFKNTTIKPKIVITDSQVIKKANKIVPSDIPLTGFSVLYAKQKGNFEAYLNGTPKISTLKDNDKILFLESCTHHVSCEDIGRYKLPRWITEFTKKKLSFEIISGLSPLPENLNNYALVVQCGACMVTQRQILNRLQLFINAGVPVTNYGMAISWAQGVYNRIVEPFLNK